jgi:hypothetical protein
MLKPVESRLLDFKREKLEMQTFHGRCDDICRSINTMAVDVLE